MKLKIIVFFFKVLEPPVDGHAVLEELADPLCLGTAAGCDCWESRPNVCERHSVHHLEQIAERSGALGRPSNIDIPGLAPRGKCPVAH